MQLVRQIFSHSRFTRAAGKRSWTVLSLGITNFDQTRKQTMTKSFVNNDVIRQALETNFLPKENSCTNDITNEKTIKKQFKLNFVEKVGKTKIE